MDGKTAFFAEPGNLQAYLKIRDAFMIAGIADLDRITGIADLNRMAGIADMNRAVWEMRGIKK
ncbi:MULTISPECIES: hypothetical protein [unclassified Bilifractor]|uniref:hypothetical protein n=1 Tax=unclassified Bilifractor TaxID=2815795 RepID=UPI003F8F96FE